MRTPIPQDGPLRKLRRMSWHSRCIHWPVPIQIPHKALIWRLQSVLIYLSRTRRFVPTSNTLCGCFPCNPNPVWKVSQNTRKLRPASCVMQQDNTTRPRYLLHRRWTGTGIDAGLAQRWRRTGKSWTWLPKRRKVKSSSTTISWTGGKTTPSTFLRCRGSPGACSLPRHQWFSRNGWSGTISTSWYPSSICED